MEYDEYKVGDGGFIAKFSDGTVTGAAWKAETFYIAPLDAASCVPSASDEPKDQKNTNDRNHFPIAME